MQDASQVVVEDVCSWYCGSKVLYVVIILFISIHSWRHGLIKYACFFTSYTTACKQPLNFSLQVI